VGQAKFVRADNKRNNKSDTSVHTKKTRCSAVAERPRCRVRYRFGQK